MIATLLVAGVIGGLVGGVVGAFATRSRKYYTIYILAGILGGIFYAVLPYLRGREGLNGDPKFTAIMAAISVGAAIMFTSGIKK